MIIKKEKRKSKNNSSIYIGGGSSSYSKNVYKSIYFNKYGGSSASNSVSDEEGPHQNITAKQVSN